MRVVLVSRYPLVDVPAWKRELAHRLLGSGIELGVLYSRAPVADHLVAAIAELGSRGSVGYTGRGAAPGDGSPTRRRSLASWARARDIPVMLHRRLTDPECADSLRRFDPELLLLTGADIVPESLLDIPPRGTLNPHYGLLPAYRGMNVTEWSIYHDDPVGVTVHYVSRGIDTGDIALQQHVEVVAGDTLATLRRKHQDLAARLLGEAVERIGSGTLERRPQVEAEGRQYYRMHPLLRHRVERRLAEGAYARIDD